MKKKKSKKATKPKPEPTWVGSFDKAAKALNVRREALQMARDADCDAFHASGRVNVKKLKAFLEANPEIIAATKDLPDAKLEKALKMRAERKSAELEYERSIGSVVDMSKVQPLIMGLAKMVRAKLRQIPDRCSQKYSLMTDALVIKDDLKTEIDSALRAMSDFKIEDFKKEIVETA